MAEETSNGERPHYMCVGVGIGPANLSLASLLHSHPEVSNRFFEKRESFGWHDGQQIAGASLQVSALKDLVTLADPTNAFTFLAYLHAQGRIYHFINAQFDAVPRQEFRNYLEWASQRNRNLVFGQEVLSVEFDGRFVLRTTSRTVTADNIVVGVGTQPMVPPFARSLLGATQFHVSEFVERARGLAGKRVGVVGGGQSGAEAFLDLISRPPGKLPGRIAWISRRANYLPIDDSPFTNDFYMPGHSDHFFRLDRPAREDFTARFALTSDGVSEATLRRIYQKLYLHRFVDGHQDLVALYPDREVTQVVDAGATGWDIAMRRNGQPDPVEHIEVDVVVWATGFQPAPTGFLAPVEHRLERTGEEYAIDEDFAVRWDGPLGHDIFVQNAARQQRGLADPNLSLLAWRSQRIVDRLRGVRSNEQLPSFIEWPAKPPT